MMILDDIIKSTGGNKGGKRFHKQQKGKSHAATTQKVTSPITSQSANPTTSNVSNGSRTTKSQRRGIKSHPQNSTGGIEKINSIRKKIPNVNVRLGRDSVVQQIRQNQSDARNAKFNQRRGIQVCSCFFFKKK